MVANVPDSPDEVLSVITAAERYRKFVWTAGRVLREMALWTAPESLPYPERKAALKRLTGLLENPADQGVLSRRPEVQNIGYGDESGFDYIGSTPRPEAKS